MRALDLVSKGKSLRVLCLGAHSDDIEIGAGGALLTWLATGAKLDVTWAVASAIGERAAEAEASARDFLAGAASLSFSFGQFRDSFFPYEGAALKSWVNEVKAANAAPDIVLTHWRSDAHQDHRELNQLTWNAFRDHLILEYEIPKWDGDLGQPNTYVALSKDVMARKVELLLQHFGTQRSKGWFDAETFRGLARLRGVECRAPEGYAEAFTVRKLLLG
jgi:LmbE family N-acetylglucosaminyl deacetylase